MHQLSGQAEPFALIVLLLLLVEAACEWLDGWRR